MKKLFLLLAIFAMGLMIVIPFPAYAKSKPAAKHLSKTTPKRFVLVSVSGRGGYLTYVDTKTIKYKFDKDLKENVIDSWDKTIYTVRGKERFLNQFDETMRGRLRNLDYQRAHWLYSKDKFAFISSAFYSKEGNVLYSKDETDRQWNEIIPNSVGKEIKNFLFNYAKKHKMKLYKK